MLVRSGIKSRCGCDDLLTRVQVNIRVTDGAYLQGRLADGASAGLGEGSVGRNGPAHRAWNQS